MSRLAEICIRRPVFATMLVGVIVVMGLLSFGQLGTDLYPKIEFPYTSVITTLPGSSVEEVEGRITKPIEEAVTQVEGIDYIHSSSSEGLSSVLVAFELERDSAQAAQDVRDKLAFASGRLPREADAPRVTRFDFNAVPVLGLAVAGDRDPRELTEIAERRIKENLQTVRGVGAVELVGTQKRAIQIVVDSDRLGSYGLSITQVRAALRTQNVELPGGRVDQGSRELVLRTLGRVRSVSEFGSLVVGTLGDRPVMLSDIASIEDGSIEARSHATLDGRPALLLNVRKQSGANTTEVAQRVRQRLAEIVPTLPPDIRIETVKDQSRFISASIDEARFHLLLGGILVALSTIFFLRDWRSTVIAALAIPTSLIGTFTFLWMMDFTINNLTLLGLILSIGVVIDDAVVVLENIHRHVEEKGKSPFQAAIDGTKEIGLAVLATTLSLIVIFVPLAFMSGMSGRFLHEFGLTVAVAIFISMIISFTLTPMLCSRFLRPPAPGKELSRNKGIYAAIENGYAALLAASLRRRWIVVAMSAVVILSTIPIFMAIGKDFIPTDDQGEFEVSLQAPEGFTLSRTQTNVAELAGRISKLTGVRNALVQVGGGGFGDGEGDVTAASIYVKLAPLDERELSQREVMILAREVASEFPDLRASIQESNPFGGSRRSDFEFDIVGPDLTTLARLGQTLADRLRTMPGYVDVDLTLALRKPEIQVDIDRERAADLGIRVEDIASTLRTLVGGETVGFLEEDDTQYDVQMRAALPFRDDPRAILDLKVARPNGELVPLSSVITISEDRGPAQIRRLDRQRRVTISANLEGVALSDAVQTAQEIVKEAGLPPHHGVRLSHNAKQMAQMASNFGFAFLLSAIFMYMVLAAQFESFIYPISILVSLPLSVPFALLSLLLIGENLNLYSILGLFMLFGIVKKNGILQIDYTNQLRAAGMARDAAILLANRVRLRPILMTTVMLVLGMVPIAIGRGPGAASRASMADVIIGGQTLCLVLTLLGTPVAYSLLDDLGGLWGRLRAKRRATGPFNLAASSSEDAILPPTPEGAAGG